MNKKTEQLNQAIREFCDEHFDIQTPTLRAIASKIEEVKGAKVSHALIGKVMNSGEYSKKLAAVFGVRQYDKTRRRCWKGSPERAELLDRMVSYYECASVCEWLDKQLNDFEIYVIGGK